MISTEELIDSYKELGSVHRVGDKFGLCGAAVYRRMVRYGFKFSKPRSFCWSKTPQPIDNPSELDIAWTAGFIEGEGCFSKSTGSITVPQVNEEPLIKLQRLFGGSIRYRHAETRTGNRIWVWRLHGKMSRELRSLIRPYMSRRRREQMDRSAY